MQQTTLAAPVTLSGHGVHTAQPVQMTLQPAPAGTGRVFVRTDLPGQPSISAHADKIDPTIMMSTGLVDAGVQVRTTEHVLAALQAMQVDNVRIEMNAVECPILDGSALLFAQAIDSVGVSEQPTALQYLVVQQSIRVGDESAWAELQPHDDFRVSICCQFPHPAITPTEQSVVYEQANADFMTTLAPARTFGFLADYERAKQAGYALGSSLENTIVFDDAQQMNEEPLRFADECARHKCLDVIGDLALLGHRIRAEYKGFCAGHALTGQLMQALLQSPEAWQLVNE